MPTLHEIRRYNPLHPEIRFPSLERLHLTQFALKSRRVLPRPKLDPPTRIRVEFLPRPEGPLSHLGSSPEDNLIRTGPQGGWG